MPLPLLTLLTPSQCAEIHAASLHILETAGVRVDSPRARQIFARSGGCRLVEDRVYLTPELVESALKSAPATIQVYDRRGDPSLTSARSAPARLRDSLARPRLTPASAWASPTCTTRTPPAKPSPPSPARSWRAACAWAKRCPASTWSPPSASSTTSPRTSPTCTPCWRWSPTPASRSSCSSRTRASSPPCSTCWRALHGDLAAQPFVIPYLNPVTPLIINEGTSDKLLACVERGLPFIYSNYGMAGMSTPITPAGTLALLNAELLAGLALAQIARPGAPVILGSLPAYFDMQTMVDFYDPRTYLLNLSCAEMMAHYHLPHAGTSGSGMGWGADLLETGALWMDLLTGSLGKVGLSPFVGGALGSKAFSPSTAVYADELIAMARDFEGGFPLDATSIALDEIIAGVAEGHFLSQPETLKYFGRKRKGESPTDGSRRGLPPQPHLPPLGTGKLAGQRRPTRPGFPQAAHPPAADGEPASR